VRLILVRHAKAAPGDPDALRPLTAEGLEAAALLAVDLRALAPDAVIASPLLRARETAAPIAEAAGLELEIDERLAPGATLEDVRAVVSGRGDTVVTVGHEPDCSEIFYELTGQEVRFRTGSFHVVEL